MCESVYKVLIIGDPQVGKTSMVARYCYRDWMPNYKATVGGEENCYGRQIMERVHDLPYLVLKPGPVS